jgi:trigger factor
MNKELAGKTAVIKMKVHAIKELPLPELDENFFKQFKVANLEELRKRFSEIIVEQRKPFFRSDACTKLLDQLLKVVDFPLPQALMDIYSEEMIAPRRRQAQQAGKALTDEQVAKYKEELLPQVTEAVKSTIFLMAVAKKEGLEVTDSEVQQSIYRQATDANQDPQTLLDYYRNTGLIFNLRDRLLADKGMQAIYEKAKVTMVPEAKADEAPKADEAKPEA